MGKDFSEEKEFNWHISLITFTLSHKYIELQLSLVKRSLSQRMLMLHTIFLNVVW
jgi:hypothetical protein